MSAHGYKQTFRGSRQRARFTPNSGHKLLWRWMSAYDPKRTLTTLGGFEGGVLTVQPDEHAGGAEDVDVGGHEPLERPSKG